MEVTASNFQASLPRILQAISEANFVAIDTELSGLRPVDAVRELSIDSFDARWAKVRFSASSMAMLQLGICTFRLDETSGVWTTQPFTLYVCPDSNLSLFEHDARHSFVSQTSAIHFLGRNGFDFNTMAKDSIPYLSEARAVQAEQLARADVFRRFKRVRTTFFGRAPPRAIIVGTPVSPAAGASGNGNGDSAAMSITSDADCQWFTEFKGCVEAWMAACVAPGVGGGVPPTDGLTNAAATLVESRTSTVAGFPQLTLSGCNSFQRAVMHAHVARVSEQRVVCLTEEVAPGEDSYRQDVSLSWVGDAAGFEAWERVWARKAVDVANANASNASGLLRVVKALVESGHPIVGHNCMLDVAHIGDKFFGPAPLDLTAFAQSWLRHFPITFDTKHLLCTAVGELVDAAKLRPFTSRTDLGGAYKAVTSPHLLAQVWPVSSGAHLQDTESADVVAAPLVPSAPKPLCTTRFPPGLTIPFNVPAAQPAATPVAEGVADPTAVGIDVDDAAHDAGADAYMTGVVFASVLEMAHRVAGNDAPFVWPANVCVTAGSMTAETAGAAAMVAMPSNPLMRQTANKLHMMRCTVPWQKTLNLEDAACAAAASSSVGAGTTENSVERSRQTVNHNNLLWIRSEGLLTCNTLDDVRGFVASGLGIRPALIDRRKHAHALDDNSCLLSLPSAAHVLQALQLWNEGGEAASSQDEDSIAEGDGDNMLGVSVPAPVVGEAVSSNTAAAALPTAVNSSTPESVHEDEDSSHVRALLDEMYGDAGGATDTALPALSWSTPTLQCGTYADYLEHFKPVFGHACDREVTEPIRMSTPTASAAVEPEPERMSEADKPSGYCVVQ